MYVYMGRCCWIGAVGKSAAVFGEYSLMYVSFIFPFSFVPFVVINWPPRLAAVKFVLMVRNAD